MSNMIVESAQIKRKSVSEILYSEWRYCLGGALFVFMLASIQISGFPTGLIPNLSFPYRYADGDELLHMWIIQRVIEGWIYYNPRSDFPFIADFRGYPAGLDSFNYLMFKILGYLTGSSYGAYNLFYLLSFATIFVTAYVVLRRLGLSISFALAGAIIFDLLPFHFIRIVHLFFVSYFTIPIFFYLGFILFNFTSSKIENIAQLRHILWAKRWQILLWVLFLLIAASASASIYYAFFGTILILVCGCAGAVARRSLYPMILSLVCAGIIFFGILVNLTPTLTYQFTGGTADKIARSAHDSEYYGLKFIQMILPHTNHRNEKLRSIAQRYYHSAPLVNENFTAALGMIGSLGLLAVMAVILIRLAGREPDMQISLFALIILTLFMVGTIGGLASVFAHLIYPNIRGWNRTSIFIGFGTITVFLLIVQMGIQRYISVVKPFRIHSIIAICLVLFAVWDQVSPPHLAGQQHAQKNFIADRNFIQNIEASLPPNAAIYQLPYTAFPLSLYSHRNIVGFLHSETLRWNTGGLSGSESDVFSKELSQEPIAKQVETVRQLGFAGISVDRVYYADKAQQIIVDLSAELGYGPTLIQQDGKSVFFHLDKNIALQTFEKDRELNFSNPYLPFFVRQVTGMSVTEYWGRWSDANLADTVRIDFTTNLPERFILALEVVGFGPNAKQAMSVKVGDTTYEVVLPAEPAMLRIKVDNKDHARSIEIQPPQPTSPDEMGLSADERKLGIGFYKLMIETEE